MTDTAGYFDNATATFGDRVTAAREAKGYSQQELAHKLGVKTKTVRDWEDDTSEPRANKLQLIAGITNVSIIWLLTGEGDGVDYVHDAELPEDIGAITRELTETSAKITQLSAHLMTLERRLKVALKGAA